MGSHLEPCNDDVRVELKTEVGLYCATINVIQAEIIGQFEEIRESRRIEVRGQLIP